MPSLEFVRRFAGADPGADSTVLEACLSAAVDWYEKAGVPAGMDSALYDFWVANLAAWMFDNRGSADASAAVPAYIVASVHQLRPRMKGGSA